MKTCSNKTCRESRPLNEFSKNKGMRDGYNNWCKQCIKGWRINNIERVKEYNYNYGKRNRQRRKEYSRSIMNRWVEVLEKHNYTQCRNCGYDRCFAAIDFHHTADKKFGVALKINNCPPTEKRIQEILSELEMCIPLCANCHRELHYTVGGDVHA